MNWHLIISLISAFTLSLPLILIFGLRLFTNKSFLALGIHYLLAFVYNLMTAGILPTTISLRRNFAITNNLLDIPLLLIFLLFFTRSWRLSKQLVAGLAAYIIFEIISIIIAGYSITSTTIVLGPGILIIVCFSFYFFLKHIQVQDSPAETGKIVMLCSLLFAYGSYSLIYIFHYILKVPYIQDVFLIYYLVTIIASLAMATGIWLERKKITQSEVEALTGAPIKKEHTQSKGVTKVAPLNENEFRYK